MKRCIEVSGETAILAEGSLRKTFLASEPALLKLALRALLVGWPFFKIENLGNVFIAVWKPLYECLIQRLDSSNYE